MVWVYLVIAIAAEVFATSALKMSEGFTKLIPSIGVLIGYSVAFYLLAIVVRVVPVGIAYAIWAGLGVVLVTLVGWFVFNQKLDAYAFLGIGLILAGVLVLNVLSSSSPH